MSNSNPNYKSSYGVNQPIVVGAPAPVVAKRDPQSSDIGYPIGIEWIRPSTNSIWILTSIVSNVANWEAIGGSGTGVFGALTVSPGPISLTGTTTINTSGSAVTTIGTGGTGAVNIGNATGNTAVTGSLTASTGLIATTGGITATGTSNINTSGAAVTTINTGGTGALHLGNTTGNTAVTGSLSTTTSLAATTTVTAGTGITSTTGNIVATAGSVQAGTSVIATTVVQCGTNFVTNTGAFILSGAGSPSGSVTAPQGSLYLNTTGNSTSTRAYINSDSGTTWIAITTAS